MTICRQILPVALLLPICLTGHAQFDTETEDELDTIIVTGSRSPIELANVGSSTTVITREEIERRQARYVTDMLRAVPGFAVSHSGVAGSQTQVRVRGAEANQVLVLIDGVRANDPASGDEFRWELLSTADVERIEIVRGAQSSLWGSDALAGVVRVITRSGSSQPEIGGYVEGGSNNTANGGLNGGLGGEDWSLRLGFESLNTDGANISRVGTEDDESDMTTASLAAQFNLSEKFSMNFSARSVDAYSQFDPIDFVSTGLPTDGDLASDATQLYVNADASLSTLNDRLVHKFRVAYLDTDNKTFVDGVSNESTASDRTTLTYQADIQINENMLSLALENEKTEFSQRGEVIFGDPNQDQEMTVNSVIADYQGKSIDRFTWLLSARYDDNSDFDDVVTGRLALAYQVRDATLLRASVGTGQKAPTFIERYGFFPGQFIGNPDLKPEESTSYDIGIDQRLFDDSLDLQLTLFNQDLENEINGFVFDPVTFLFTAENIAGSSSRSGVEFASTLHASENLQFYGSYTYTDSTEDDGSGNDVPELRRPRHTGSVSANISFLEQRANLLLTADYGGSRTDIFFPPFPAPSEIVTLDSYWLVDLTASLKLGRRTSVFVRGTNLLDEEYEQVYGFSTLGRSAFVGLRANFGQ